MAGEIRKQYDTPDEDAKNMIGFHATSLSSKRLHAHSPENMRKQHEYGKINAT